MSGHRLTDMSSAQATRLAAAIAVGALSVGSVQAGEAPAHEAARGKVRHIAFDRWRGADLRAGHLTGARLQSGAVVVGRGARRVRYDDPYDDAGPRAYDRGRWISPWIRARFGLTELIASYNAVTPIGTFLEVSVRGRRRPGVISSWDGLGRWASHDRRFHRMSLGPQTDDYSRVAVDTLVTDSGVRYHAWRLRVDLLRRADSAKTPRLTMIGATASRLPARTGPVSEPGPGVGVDLDVPRYSQEIHRGEYPRWNGGGEAWCSPTSTSMALAFFGRGPTPRQYAWVDPDYRQPWVDYAARFTYAWRYGGSGMWPFNTAYAARFGVDAFVTRLRSLREAELFVDAGIPLVASIAFDAGELDGAPISSTAGHLLVIRGFTDAGRVIVNDPAAPTANTVRRVYKRSQFERAWIGATGGVVYVIHPPGAPLPAPREHSNW
jgi:hypothetical protein